MQQMLINARPQDAYRRQDVLTASPIDLIVMLYDALKRNILLGKRGIANNNIPLAHKHLIKAQLILTELINSLDMTYDISKELFALYEFALKSVADANMHKDVAPLAPVIDMVDSIKEAWQEVSRANRGTMSLGVDVSE